jgi:hypothetical protein
MRAWQEMIPALTCLGKGRLHLFLRHPDSNLLGLIGCITVIATVGALGLSQQRGGGRQNSFRGARLQINPLLLPLLVDLNDVLFPSLRATGIGALARRDWPTAFRCLAPYQSNHVQLAAW